MLKIFRQNISRSPYQSIAAVIVVSLSFFLISFFFLVGIGSRLVLNYFESKPQVTAFIKDEAKLQEIELMKSKIESSFDVTNISYVSKEDALKIYREQNKDKPLLLEMVTAKILPASLEISTRNLASLKLVADFLKKEKIIEDVIYQEDVIASLSGWIDSIKKIGIVVAAFLLFISFLTILVVLGTKVSRKKEDIEIYKLLGASGWYIKLPLFLEGIFYGLVSAVIAWTLNLFLVLYSSPFLIKFLSGIPLLSPFPLVFFLMLLGGMIGVGILVGFLSSFLAVSRFLNKAR